MDRHEFEEKWKKVGSPKKIDIGNNVGYVVAIDYDFDQNYVSFFTGESEYYLFHVGKFRLEDIVDVKSKWDEESE